MYKITAAFLLALYGYGCGGGGWSPTQADPTNDNQAYMISEAARIERLMGMGQFFVYFQKPPAATYAGWSNCQQGASKPPYIVYFNEDWIRQPHTEQYMTALLAHEMCHQWVPAHGGSCWDEVAAENCATRYAK